MELNNKNEGMVRVGFIGSVDDGKSTLIGRILHDTEAVYEDQIKAIEQASKRRGEEYLNLALLTDGLKAEREQGITIDVAYRYFQTPKRKFVISDCPGHIEYTQNMFTGVSRVNVVTILIDARNGITEQTRRHTLIASLLHVKHLIVCINKLDTMDYSQERYEEIKQEFCNYLVKTTISDVRFIPMSALHGDNVVKQSVNTRWYNGGTLLSILEDMFLGSDPNHVDCRFPVQMVIRPMSEKYADYRGFAGRIESGIFKKGDEVVLLPSGFKTKIKEINLDGKSIDQAFSPMSVTILLEDEYDLSRGGMIVKPNNMPKVTQDLELMVCWLSKSPLKKNRRYILKHTTNDVQAELNEVRYKIDLSTLHKLECLEQLEMNDLGRISLRTSSPVFVDEYSRNRATGAAIIIDSITNETVGAATVV